MTKVELAALERVFSAEIDGRLPYQSKARIFDRLCADGLVYPMERRFGSGPLSVAVTGWQLTHAGRIAYCSSC